VTFEVALPDPVVVVLVGAAGSGKSTWAASQFAPGQVVSSDALRAMVGRDESDLSASSDAFSLLDTIVEARCKRGLTTVVDTVGLDEHLRARLRALAASARLPCHAVVFLPSLKIAKEQNAQRAKRVPEKVVADQFQRVVVLEATLTSEGFDGVHRIVGARSSSSGVSSGEPLAVSNGAGSDGVAYGGSLRGSGWVPSATIGVGASVVRTRAPGLASVESTSADGNARRLKFGLQLSSFPWPAAEHRDRLTEIAQRCEAVGFDSMWTMDHFRQIPQIGREWDDMYEATTTLAHIAAVTSRVTVGTLVASVTHRNIGVLGKAMTTLDVLSGGRAVCGIGLGWFKAEHEAYGLAFPSVSERYGLLEDALEALPMLWGKGAPAFAGRQFSAGGLLGYPRPLQARIPLLVGGSGEKQTLRLVAKFADACNLFGDPATVARKLTALQTHCQQAYRNINDIEVTHLSTALVGENSKQLAERIAQLRFSPKMLSAQNPGTVTDHTARIQSLVDAGVQHVIVSMPGITTSDIERFGQVIQAVRSDRNARLPVI
jgi:alkanesulfonate monooxygenase SsuD/methylene tetrahydromethanopterin reductase-like flavin-dependent oxidoreductase (luciferase family)/predicted kinase